MPRIFATILLFAVALQCTPDALGTQTFFVSTTGNDAWSGRLATRTAETSEGPFATVERAQQAVRAYLASQPASHEDVTVWIRRGTYPLKGTLRFSEADSGAVYAPVRWCAYPGEPVLFSGGSEVRGFQRLSETKIPSRIPKAARAQVWVVDLRALGIDDYGQLVRRGLHIPYQPSALQLYYKGQPMTLARYPNTGWETIADVPQDGEQCLNEGHFSDKRHDGVPTGRHFGMIEYAGDRPDSWQNAEEAWMHGYWTWDWADSTQKIARIDTERKRITIVPPHNNYGYTKGQRFYYFNIPEELDAPGEWYLDRGKGLLYFWPPDDDAHLQAQISRLETALLSVEGARFLSFQGIAFAYSRGPAVSVADSHSVEIDRGEFYCLGGLPVNIQGGSQCGVRNSHFHELDTGGLVLEGGNRKTLERGDHYAINNHFENFGLVYRTNHPAILIGGVGQRAAHNLMHNAPHVALRFSGNDHLIEYNEIHDIAKETGDVGAIYIGRDYTSRGSVVRYNYLHDLHGPGLHGVRAVYLDDFTSGITVYGNLFYRAGRAAFIGGGRDNRIQNNVFIECAPSVQVDGRGLSWANHHFDQDHSHYASTLRDKMAEMNATQPPYSLRYPRLVTLYADQPKVPKGNIVENNLSLGGIFLDLFDGVDLELVTVRNNLVADPIPLRMTDETDQAPNFTVFKREDEATAEQLSGNVLWKSSATIFRLVDGRVLIDWDAIPEQGGFTPLPIEQMGLIQP